VSSPLSRSASSRRKTLTKRAAHLLDVNTLVALLDEAHIHHRAATQWFDTRRLQWALCPFTEAGVLRFFTRPKTGELTLRQATAMLDSLKQQPGYRYQPIAADWNTLTKPLSRRLHGYRQVTDAFLLGLAIHDDLVLATFDSAILHLAGEYNKHVHLLAN